MSTIAQDAARHQIGRLEHDRVAVAERRRDLPRRDGDREIPRRDDADDADRLAGHRHVDAGTHARHRLAGQAQASPAKKSKICAGAHRLADAFGQRLALLARQQPAESPRGASGSRRRPPCRMSWRCWMPERDQAGKAAFAAAMARLASSAVAARIVADDVVGVGRIDVGRRPRRRPIRRRCSCDADRRMTLPVNSAGGDLAPSRLCQPRVTPIQRRLDRLRPALLCRNAAD